MFEREREREREEGEGRGREERERERGDRYYVSSEILNDSSLVVSVIATLELGPTVTVVSDDPSVN